MTPPNPTTPDSELDNLVRDIMKVPYSKHNAKAAIAAFMARREAAAREDEREHCKVIVTVSGSQQEILKSLAALTTEAKQQPSQQPNDSKETK